LLDSHICLFYTIIQQPYGANGLQTLKTVLKKTIKQLNPAFRLCGAFILPAYKLVGWFGLVFRGVLDSILADQAGQDGRPAKKLNTSLASRGEQL